ncbi:P-loop containing nucleoside triphosphate hydrolase protein [Xylariaceae sp. FL0804]|nr:P-loop containing nucleoside triphosphate hydrolase protein [Xylariaceae sp. FL0804]
MNTCLLTIGSPAKMGPRTTRSHGWDLMLEQPTRMPGWTRLAHRKWVSGEKISAADFDELLGQHTAVTDIAAFYFAPELIKAYPDAKVVLNYRKDMNKWMASMEKTLLPLVEASPFYLASWFESNIWWHHHFTMRYLFPLFFRAPSGDTAAGIRKCGPRVYQEHCNMVKGMVPPERLLEWTVEDGWEPLCRFLGKDIPDEPFPHVNGNGDEFKERGSAVMGRSIRKAALNFVAIAFFAVVGIVIQCWR